MEPLTLLEAPEEGHPRKQSAMSERTDKEIPLTGASIYILTQIGCGIQYPVISVISYHIISSF